MWRAQLILLHSTHLQPTLNLLITFMIPIAVVVVVCDSLAGISNYNYIQANGWFYQDMLLTLPSNSSYMHIADDYSVYI